MKSARKPLFLSVVVLALAGCGPETGATPYDVVLGGIVDEPSQGPTTHPKASPK